MRRDACAAGARGGFGIALRLIMNRTRPAGPAERRRAQAIVASAVLWLAAPPAGARAQVEWEFDPAAVQPWIEQGLNAMDRVFGPLQSNWTEQIAVSFEVHMQDLMAAAEAAMQEAHPEDMADLQPYLRAAARQAARISELAPYAAWLDARLDYFDAARAAVALTPAPPKLWPQPQPKPPAWPPATPEPRPAPPPVAPPTRPPATPSAPAPRPPATTPSRPPATTPSRPPARPARRPPVPAEIENKRIETAVARPAWRKRVATRPKPASAAEFVPSMKRAFRSAGVPEELVWLAEVESTMNPDARSPRGAVGLFQITSATAKSLGLSLSPRDERRDPERSAAAAAKYLRYLHDRFGSWPLALAAYNAGEGRISGLLKKHGATDFDGIAPSLPMETRMYVPRVLETVRLREGVDPDRLPAPGDVAT